MSEGLGQKTAQGMVWSLLEKGATQATNLVVGIVLARILPPEDFGLVAMLTIFVSLSGILVDSGFGMALIRKKDKSEVDLSSVFFFNVAIGLACFGLMWIISPLVAGFYKTPVLSQILRWLSLVFVFISLSIVQYAVLRERLNFKAIAVANFVAAIISGGVAVVFAYRGAGVWALVMKSVLQALIVTVVLSLFLRWRPRLVFSMRPIRELFRFGSNLLISSFLFTIVNNLSSILIGKFFKSQQLGYFARGASFADLIFGTFFSVTMGVAFPSLSSIADDRERLKNNSRKMVNACAIVICFAMCLFAVVARPFVSLFLTDRWLPAVPVIWLLCVARSISAIGVTNLSMLQAAGRSDLTLRVDLIKAPINVASIVIGVQWGILGVAAGQVVFAAISFFLNTWYTKKLYDYGALEQLRDLRLVFGALVVMAAAALGAMWLVEPNALKLLLGIAAGSVAYLAVLRAGGSPEFAEMIGMAKKMIKQGLRFVRAFFRLNLRKTLIVNFRFLPFRQVLRLPIHVRGPLKVYGHGKITIDAPVHSGMIRLGYNGDLFSATKGGAQLWLNGEIVFKGEMIASGDVSISVFNGARLTFGRFGFLGYGMRIQCHSTITIGDWFRITAESQIFDTGFHHIRDLNTGKVARLSGSGTIGDHCWVGNRTTVMRGTVLPNGCIVASNSLINKDYVKMGVKPNSLLAGSPAKVVAEGKARVFNPREEARIHEFFAAHPEAAVYASSPKRPEDGAASGH